LFGVFALEGLKGKGDAKVLVLNFDTYSSNYDTVFPEGTLLLFQQ